MEKQENTEDKIKQIAQQLRCPIGDAGVEMGDRMYQTNTSMLVNSLPLLNIADKKHILEIGHGNCKHLDLILSQAQKLRYCGLEISELMQKEAIRNNSNAVSQKQAKFHLYDGRLLPFAENSFDCVITVNTLYFFDTPIDIFCQINKTLKKGGTFVLTFQKKEFIETLSFTKYNFSIYSTEKVRQMLLDAGLVISGEQEKEEDVISKTGEKVTRKYIIIQCLKNN